MTLFSLRLRTFDLKRCLKQLPLAWYKFHINRKNVKVRFFLAFYLLAFLIGHNEQFVDDMMPKMRAHLISIWCVFFLPSPPWNHARVSSASFGRSCFHVNKLWIFIVWFKLSIIDQSFGFEFEIVSISIWSWTDYLPKCDSPIFFFCELFSILAYLSDNRNQIINLNLTKFSLLT